MIHYGTLISNGKSERPGGIKSGASGDLAISKEFKVFMFAALVDFIFLIQTGSFWVEQNKKGLFQAQTAHSSYWVVTRGSS